MKTRVKHETRTNLVTMYRAQYRKWFIWHDLPIRGTPSGEKIYLTANRTLASATVTAYRISEGGGWCE